MFFHKSSSMFFIPSHFREDLNYFLRYRIHGKMIDVYFVRILIPSIHRPSVRLPPFWHFSTPQSRLLKDFYAAVWLACQFYRLLKFGYCGHILTPAAILQVNLAPTAHIIGAYKHLVPHRRPFHLYFLFFLRLCAYFFRETGTNRVAFVHATKRASQSMREIY